MDTEVVTDVNAESSPATTESGPSLEERAYALAGKAREHWMLTGDVDAAEALQPPQDVTAESSAVQAPERESSAQAGDTRTPDPKLSKREKKSPDQSFAELRSRAERAEAERDLLQRQAAESRTSPPVARTEEAAPGPSVDDGEPLLETFTSLMGTKYDGFEQANRAWIKAYRVWERGVEAAEATEKQRNDSWNSSMKAVTAKYSDFKQVADAAELDMPNVTIAAMRAHKDAGELYYYLCKNLDVSMALAERTWPKSDDPRAIGRAEAIAELELDRIAESLKKRTASTKETIARQPRPTSEVAVEPNRSAADDEETDAINRGDTAAYIRIANKRDTERFRNGG